jgi:hypothetical protein
MRHLYTGLAFWNLLLQAAFLVLAFLQDGTLVVSPRAFQLAAVFVAVFCLVVHSLLIIHFIGSMKWMQQSGPTAGIEDTKPLRRAWIKGPLFPLLVTAMLVAVAVGILTGGSRLADVPRWVYLGLAALGVALNGAIVPLARRVLDATKRRLHDLADRMDARIAQGEVRDEDAQALLPESGRAGGKTLVFLGLNVWLLYGYNRFVLRDLTEPVWPYAVACAILLLTGAQMLRRYHRTAA